MGGGALLGLRGLSESFDVRIGGEFSQEESDRSWTCLGEFAVGFDLLG